MIVPNNPRSIPPSFSFFYTLICYSSSSTTSTSDVVGLCLFLVASSLLSRAAKDIPIPSIFHSFSSSSTSSITASTPGRCSRSLQISAPSFPCAIYESWLRHLLMLLPPSLPPAILLLPASYNTHNLPPTRPRVNHPLQIQQ